MKIATLILAIALTSPFGLALAQEKEHRPEPREHHERQLREREQHERELRDERERDERAHREREMREREHHERERAGFAEFEEQVLTFAENKMPEFKQALVELREADPPHYKEAIHHTRRIMGEYEEQARHGNEAQAEIFVKAHGMDFLSMVKARKIAQTKDEAKRKAQVAELRTYLGQIFDAKQELRKAELERIKQEATHLAELLEKRQASRDQVIEHRLSELLPGTDREMLQW